MQSIITPHEHDILAGRGNQVNRHIGNVFYRDLVREKKAAYTSLFCCYTEKKKIISEIFEKIESRNPPGRFLMKERESGLWTIMDYKTILKKIGQALREKESSLSGESQHSSITLTIPEDKYEFVAKHSKTEPHTYDILAGKRDGINMHAGNICVRELVKRKEVTSPPQVHGGTESKISNDKSCGEDLFNNMNLLIIALPK